MCLKALTTKFSPLAIDSLPKIEFVVVYSPLQIRRLGARGLGGAVMMVRVFMFEPQRVSSTSVLVGRTIMFEPQRGALTLV